MKICEYHPRISYYVGGGELVVAEQIARLSKKNDVTIVTSETNNPTEQFRKLIRENNVGVEYVKNPLMGMEIGSIETAELNKWDIESLVLGETTKDYFEKNKFDLVVTHYSVDNLLLPYRCNNVLHLHGVPPRQKELDTLSLRNTKHFVSVADFVTNGWRVLHNLSPGIPTCFNGIDTSKFYDKNLERNIDILYLGRLVPYKRVDLLIEGLRGLENLKVCIGGSGIERKRLETKANNYGLNIEFLGYVPDEKIVDLYNNAKIFVHAADTREGVITTGLEAMACGTIPVVSGSCGMLEAVSDGFNGFTFEPGNHRSLNQKLLTAHQNLDKLSEIKKNAKQTILEKFDCNVKTAELEEIYRRYLYQNGK